MTQYDILTSICTGEAAMLAVFRSMSLFGGAQVSKLEAILPEGTIIIILYGFTI